jgi:hypothetical protein
MSITNNLLSSIDYYINTNKYLVGLAMIMLNIGSKFISVQFSKSTEEYLKLSVTKQILLFSMAFLGTRCLITSLVLVAVFTILSDHLFNEESKYCIIPHKYRILYKLVDTNNDGKISEEEINNAVKILEKAKKQKEEKTRRESFITFHEYKSSMF